MGEFADNQQETCNLTYVELVNTDNINYPC